MSQISAAMVKELRERTGQGMMECKKALVAAEGDIEKAIDDMHKQDFAASHAQARALAQWPCERTLQVPVSGGHSWARVVPDSAQPAARPSAS